MRECNGCTECCKWLVAEAHGYYFQPGRPCHFKGESGCTIYKDRPEVCKSYKCEWLVNSEIPEWMKPTLSKVLITKRKWSGGDYIEVLECGEKIDSVVLNWLFMYHYMTSIPIRIQVDRGWNNYGPLEFREEISKQVLIPQLVGH